MEYNVKTQKTCQACGLEDLRMEYDLGHLPLANSYISNLADSETLYPLAVSSCNYCSHLQLTYIVNPDLLFKQYSYRSGVSKPMIEFFQNFAEKTAIPGKRILDIGCNDGSQLDAYKALGMDTYGVDPSANLYEETSLKHKITLGYYDKPIRKQGFDIVTIQNCFAHVVDQKKMLENALIDLADNGSLYIMTSQADMVLNGEFDTIYHEHISYYNAKSMNAIVKASGAYITNIEKADIHGGSYIFTIKKFPENFDIAGYILQETNEGRYNYEAFAKKASYTMGKFIHIMNTLNTPIVGYSAPAKGMTFLCSTGYKSLLAIIDDTPEKQGKFTPGTHIPIRSIEYMENLSFFKSITFLILAWNYYDEIKQKIKKLRPDSQDTFVRYFPSIEVEYPSDIS